MKRLRYWLFDVRYRLKFVLTGDCGHACDWCHPWGWVPEDGCPVHDVEQRQNICLGEEGSLWVSTSTGECLAGEAKVRLKLRVNATTGLRIVGKMRRWPTP